MSSSITPNGQAGTQYPQPLQMSCWTTTVSNSVLNSAPVGQASRQGALWQCLQTSLSISQPDWKGGFSVLRTPGPCPSVCFSTKATCRQVLAESWPVLS